MPWWVGGRRDPSDIRVTAIRIFGDSGFQDQPVTFTSENTYANTGITALYEKKRTVLELEITATRAVERWEGILGFQLSFRRDGNPSTRNVNTKFFVRHDDDTRPFRAIGKRVIRAKPKLPQVLDSEGSLTESASASSPETKRSSPDC